jgi:transposase
LLWLSGSFLESRHQHLHALWRSWASRHYDRDLFKSRRLIENFFARLKQFRAIATRYDKTKRNYLGAIHLAAAVIWLH